MSIGLLSQVPGRAESIDLALLSTGPLPHIVAEVVSFKRELPGSELPLALWRVPLRGKLRGYVARVRGWHGP